MTSREWMTSASCRDHDPDLFFPSERGEESGRAIARAAVVCMSCPVTRQCREYADALHVPFGVWHGQARSGPLAPIIPLPLAPHGTEAAARRHHRAGETPCGPCREAAAWAQRQRKGRA